MSVTAEQPIMTSAGPLPAGLIIICAENGYEHPRVLPDGRWVAIMRLLYTGAVITMQADHASLCYEDRWCYHSVESAKRALDAWDGEGEPQGWHRHPRSGRRRPNADPLKEYIDP